MVHRTYSPRAWPCPDRSVSYRRISTSSTQELVRPRTVESTTPASNQVSPPPVSAHTEMPAMTKGSVAIWVSSRWWHVAAWGVSVPPGRELETCGDHPARPAPKASSAMPSGPTLGGSASGHQRQR